MGHTGVYLQIVDAHGFIIPMLRRYINNHKYNYQRLIIFVFSTCWLFPISGRDASPYLHQQRWNDCPVTFGSRNFMCFGWFGGNSASLCLSWMVQKIRQKCREHDLNHGTTTG